MPEPLKDLQATAIKNIMYILRIRYQKDKVITSFFYVQS